jgi:hypothetical protein
MNDMTYLKPTKEKIRLFLFLIISAFIAGIFSIFLQRFLIVNYYQGTQIPYHQLINFFISIFQNLIIAYLTIAFYKKKFSPQGEFYTIFKVTALLVIFSFLYQLFLSYVGRQAPDIFFSNWLNVVFVATNLAWYYLLVCIVYDFNRIKL